MFISTDILVQAANGDIKAFEQIYNVTSGFVYNVALRITNNRSDAEEVTQDVFMQVLKNLKNFKFRSSLKTWMYRITVNTAINRYTQSQREKKRRQRYEGEAVNETRSYKGPEFIDKEAVEEKTAFLLNMLNPKQRACIVLREMEGLSYKEIAEALRLNINTVRSRLKRARETLLAGAGKGEITHEL